MNLLVLVTPHGAVPLEQRRRLLDAHSDVQVVLVETADELAARLPEADGVVTGFPLPGNALASATRLRWAHSMGAGVDQFLTPELRAARHIRITASKGPMGQIMAEHALVWISHVDA